MTRDRNGLIHSRLTHTHRHTGRPESSRAEQTPHRQGPSKRVSGALSESLSGDDLLFGTAALLTTEIVGESHGIGLSVLWTVLCDRGGSPQTR